MSKKSLKRMPLSWPSEVEYLIDNTYEPSSLEPHPYTFPLSNDHPIHPFTSSPLLPVASDPHMPSTLVKIKSLENVKSLNGQTNHPAYPGYGLFATKDLKEQTLILKYTGVVTSTKNESVECNGKGSDYELSFNGRYCIDGLKKGSEARFINDYRGVLTKPNAIFHEYIDLHSGQVKMGVWVRRGVVKIRKGEEIMVSYGKSFWRERGKLND
ncbi:565_t:CDS:1 [Acaulospora morrowiae]|uniref:565_t:CDS:1 n=1 Tax=Acaulospora morrowiae TaxID=94023 RepID=A0A9N9FLB6_9GLOM|nr:565_t:CDS:1 [Acaulospora morrowiae]